MGILYYFIFVINKNKQLIGVLSLKQLLLSQKSHVLEDIMIPDVISIGVNSDKEEAAKTVERYDFLSIPVVDDTNKLVGVITVDDVIDVIREEAEEDLMAMGQAVVPVDASIWEHLRSRMPWTMLAFFGGVICYYIVMHLLYTFVDQGITHQFAEIMASLPMLFLMATTASDQSATVALSLIRSERLDKNYVMKFLFKEFKLSLIVSFIYTSILFSYFFGFRIIEETWVVVFSATLGIQIIVSMIVGCIIPIGLEKINLNPSTALIPMIALIVHITSVIIYFSLF